MTEVSSEQGMTLLELLLVLTIVGVLTIIVLPVSSGWTAVQSEQDALQAFQATVQQMQSYAIAHKASTNLSFSENGTVYTVTYLDSGKKKTTSFPPNFIFDSSSTLNKVDFQDNGDMFKTGSMIFQTSNGKKIIRFQFQKGRMLLYE
ncbi:prepilin-type N-terminal cleavage/methylation domain-containing protein [Sporosarcina aquimarina]|uniref:Prepilin-type N-terminal cleavage/methylation domain-containing protein n=1 Tax=Sporosarcina aquimarina TaxID=114975 RepID=A0ABU4FXY7_9BACL|nr:prepilin-type N-terminal cleavage/methylation domain-containing protein [Sporosarcina aquimarina]MDW0108938.1 prepilin-type N-terminal cleavage/methylation domain-containing protein [Sporosarcina aquimarina]